MEYTDNFINKKKKFEEKRNDRKGQSNCRNEEHSGWNKQTVQVQEVQQQSNDLVQPQKKQSRRQKDKTPSTFTQPVFSGRSQGDGRSEGTSSRGPCYNCGEEGHFSRNCPNRTTNPPLQMQQQAPPQIRFQPRAPLQGTAPKTAPAGQITNRQETICFQCCGKGHLAH